MPVGEEMDASEQVAKGSENDASEEVAQASALSNQDLVYMSLQLDSCPQDTLRLIRRFLDMNPDLANVSEDSISVNVINFVMSSMQAISSENPENPLMTKINAIMAVVYQDVLRVSDHNITDGIPVTTTEIFLRLFIYELDAHATEEHIACRALERVELAQKVLEHRLLIPSNESVDMVRLLAFERFPDDVDLAFHMMRTPSVLVIVGVVANLVNNTSSSVVLDTLSLEQVRALANEYTENPDWDDTVFWWQANQHRITEAGEALPRFTEEELRLSSERTERRTATVAKKAAAKQHGEQMLVDRAADRAQERTDGASDGSREGGMGAASGRRRFETGRGEGGVGRGQRAGLGGGEGGFGGDIGFRGEGGLGGEGRFGGEGGMGGSGGREQRPPPSSTQDVDMTEEEFVAWAIQQVEDQKIAESHAQDEEHDPDAGASSSTRAASSRIPPEVIDLLEEDDAAGPSPSRVERHEATREFADRERAARNTANRTVEQRQADARAHVERFGTSFGAP